MKRLIKLSRLSIALVIYMACASYDGPAMAQRLNAGNSHTCTLLTSGVVSCWGSNSFGQLGNGMTTDSPVPVTVNDLGAQATAVHVGSQHTCALLSTGAVRCWGRNNAGQLGNGSNTNSPLPVTVNNLGGVVTQISAGGNHTCAKLFTGAVQCWGDNPYGQLGDGTTNRSPEPVTVNGLSAAEISAGLWHTCAVLSASGAVRCWGRNNGGQLGNGTTNRSSEPVTVNNLGGQATAIAAGSSHTCALLSTGTVQCWGNDTFGQLGDGTNRRSTEPVTVNNLGASAIIIACGNERTCAILTTGVLRCWGRGSFGELGNGRISHSRVPVTVDNLGGQPTAVALGSAHTCAILLSGEVRCWGNNQKGQLGNGRTTHSLIPVSLSSVKNRS